MHDLIQLMGMDIVNQESNDPTRRTRLWLYDDVVDVLSSDMADCAIKAIVLEPPELKEICIGPNAFTKMRRLRVLIVRNVHNSFQGPIYLPNELRWFQWAGCAPWIPEFSSGPKKLMGLHMIKSSITVVPQQFKDFQQLKYINLSDCESLVSMPDLSCTPNLEELNLLNCKNLVEAHESIAYHDVLQVLNLEGCSKLSVFPNVLKSKNLRALNLRNCTRFERFPDIPHKLEGFKKLSLEGIAIKGLPMSIENLVSLEDMFLYDCRNLVSLPSSIYKLQNLENLVIECCTNLIGFPKYEDSADPCMKTGLANLRWLDLAGCNLSEVEFLENLSCFPLLRQIVLSDNNIISLPTSINMRDQLIELIVTNCHQLQEIPGLPPSLHNLYAAGCESLPRTGDLPSFQDFVHRWLTTADIYSLDPIHPDFVTILPRGEMPEWVLLAEEGSISFMASEDLYNKFLGLALCVVVGDDEQKEEISFELVSHVNGERQNSPRFSHYTLDSDHIWLEYMTPSKLWGAVDFGQIDGNYVQFSLEVSSRVVKKWGFRIICKHLEDGVKIMLQDNQLIDPALLYEIVQESTGLEAESSVMNENSSIEIDLQKDLQDCQMNTEKQSQIGTKGNHKLILTQGIRTETMLTSSSTCKYEHGGVGLQLLLLE
ncbi:disease resistance protein Roq1-like [Syzygium oleosum]|uniref:disease resistance protein Roq1-like n=1 Tax=Syzygium oleosum TaxID=219896 RepID=UPI0024B8F4B7|nr:disease resistance protein Roq1-like [Syzygium oleosum]XP_056158555.1 disease resistance protein Roq1-like [Syzygium oleosum]XP_056158556.1 disease resistance protein Roq1-like [Syzygium oleosum]